MFSSCNMDVFTFLNNLFQIGRQGQYRVEKQKKQLQIRAIVNGDCLCMQNIFLVLTFISLLKTT